MEPGFFPNCISDPTEIPPFQRPPDAFVDREGRDSRPRHLPRQKLVRRDPHASVKALVVRVVVVVVAPPVVSVLVPQDLGPVRNAYRQRRRCAAVPIAGVGALGRGLLGRRGDDAGAHRRFAVLRRAGPGEVVDVRLVEFECRVGGECLVVVIAGEVPVVWPRVVAFTSRH